MVCAVSLREMGPMHAMHGVVWERRRRLPIPKKDLNAPSFEGPPNGLILSLSLAPFISYANSHSFNGLGPRQEVVVVVVLGRAQRGA